MADKKRLIELLNEHSDGLCHTTDDKHYKMLTYTQIEQIIDAYVEQPFSKDKRETFEVDFDCRCRIYVDILPTHDSKGEPVECVAIYERENRESNTMIFDGRGMIPTPKKAAKFIIPVQDISLELLINLSHMIKRYRDREDDMIIVMDNGQGKIGFGIK